MSIWSVTPVRFQLHPFTVYGVHSTPRCFCLRHSGLGVVCQVYISPFPIHSAEYMGIGYTASPLLQVTLFVEIQSSIRRRAVVGLVRWYVARQTQTLVGAFCVDALGILAERHPIIQLAAFIYIDAGHLGHIQMIPIKAITGITFLDPHTATIFTAIENATFFCL